MNLEKLKHILNLESREEVKEILFLEQLSKEEDIIPKILQLLQAERVRNQSIISDMNFELSRTFAYIAEAGFNKKKKGFSAEFVISEIKALYCKYKTTITHTYRGSEWGKKHLADVYPEDVKKKRGAK